MKRTNWLIAAVVVVLFVVSAVAWRSTTPPVKELNLLCWTGYDEPELIEAFQEKYGVKVNFKTFVGGDAMFSLLTQSRGQYDVAVVDPEYIQKLYAAGRLSALNPADFDLSDYIPAFRKFPLTWIDGKMYAIPVEFGALGLVYNTQHVSAQDAQSLDIIYSPKVKGHVSVWDWYLPVMGVLSKGLGHEKPYDISDAQFTELARNLEKLRPQMASIAGSFPELMTSLANGNTWVVPGGAGWLTGALGDKAKSFDWSVPKEGGVMWLDSLAIAADAPHPDIAKLYVQWMTSPEAQALLAGKKAFSAAVPNAKAYAQMPAPLKVALKVSNGTEAEALAHQLSVRSLPVRQPEKLWQEAWEQFKAAGK